MHCKDFRWIALNIHTFFFLKCTCIVPHAPKSNFHIIEYKSECVNDIDSYSMSPKQALNEEKTVS